MIAWIKSIKGVLTGIAVIFIILISYAKCDAIKEAWYNSHIFSANAHGDTAKVAKAGADSIAKAGVSDSISNEILGTSAEVKASPIATKVRTSSNKVIANKSAENVKLREANTQLGKQVTDTKAAGEKPVPRAVFYVDPLYSISNVRRPMIVGRAGIDYRLLPHVSVKIEAGYMAPPPNFVKQLPEFVVNVGAHITF